MVKDITQGLMTKFFKLTNGEVRIIKDINAAVEFINESLMIPILVNICDYVGNHFLNGVWSEDEYIWFKLANHTLNSFKFKSLVIYYHPLLGMRGFIFSEAAHELPSDGILVSECPNLFKQKSIEINGKKYNSLDEISYIEGLISMGKIKEEFLFVNRYLSEGFALCFSTNFKERISENNSRLFNTIHKETDILNIYNI